MIQAINLLSLLLILSVLFAVGSSGIIPIIKVVALQGMVISAVSLFLHQDLTTGNLVFGAFLLLVRGIIIPILLYYSITRVIHKNELDPVCGYNASIFAGLLIIISAIYISSKFDFPIIHQTPLILPAAITVLLGGIFFLMARRKAVTMVIGYLMLENGIYLIGTSLSKRSQQVVEFGILLDVLIGVMIMGIVLFNIQRAFDDTDTALLRKLKD
jgi:hydrogenase-4 component E